MSVYGEREYKQTNTTAVHVDVARVKGHHQWQYVESGNINRQIPHKHTDTTACHADIAKLKARHHWKYVEDQNINR